MEKKSAGCGSGGRWRVNNGLPLLVGGQKQKQEQEQKQKQEQNQREKQHNLLLLAPILRATSERVAPTITAHTQTGEFD